MDSSFHIPEVLCACVKQLKKIWYFPPSKWTEDTPSSSARNRVGPKETYAILWN